MDVSLRPKGKLQVPPLRFASVGMTSGGRCRTLAGVEADGQITPTNPAIYHPLQPITHLCCPNWPA